MSRRSVRTIAMVGMALVILTGCASSSPGGDPATAAESEVADDLLERAREAADALGSELMGRLIAELEESGPVGAVKVCSEVAPRIAAAHTEPGLSIRRVSLRPRNPADTPDAFEAGRLRELEAANRQGKLPPESFAVVASEQGGQQFRYMRPIVTLEVCLNCHGKPSLVDPEVRELLRLRYPEDRALGYEKGDLRGAVSVVVDLR